MTERLTIHRDWTPYLTETKYFTLEYLLGLMNTLGMTSEDFSEFITGLNCDSYADLSCDIMRDMQADNQSLTYEEVYDQCMGDPEFQTTYTVYRLWNNTLTEEQAQEYYKRDCVATLEGMLEE